MAEYKESKDNPLHKEFGVWSNTLYILKKCKRYCFVVLFLLALGILCNSVLSYCWGFLSKYIIGIIEANLDQEESIKRLIIVVVIGVSVIGLLQLGSVFSQGKSVYRYVYIRFMLVAERVDRALSLQYEMLERPDVLDIHQRATRATDSNNNGIEGMMHLMEKLGTNLLTVIVTFVAVTVLDFRVVFILIALAILQYLYHRYCIRRDKKEVWDALSKVWRKVGYMERVTQDFDYAKDIRLFHLSDYLVGKQEKIFKTRLKRMDFHFNLWLSHGTLVSFIFMIGKAFVYGALIYAVLHKDMSVGDFTLYLALAVSFSGSLLEFLHRFGDYGRTSLEVDDFRSFMELKWDEKEESIALPDTNEYTIEFHDVSYRYLEAEKYALEHLNLVISPGERLAVVGINGAGKTTMIKLLLRLYDPTEGYITLNGVDIRKFDRTEYYKLFAPVFQNVEVLAFPIAENISMKKTAETDVDKAFACAAEAGLKEKIDSLDKGIQTELLKIVDDNGVDFSGGERQKLALARALYKDADFVVLDEPTSALDAIAEQRLYESFDQMIGKKSAVYISHRLASTRFCNHVAMFMNGKMIEYGTHEELMAMKGEYAHMFEVQAQYYQEEYGEVEA